MGNERGIGRMRAGEKEKWRWHGREEKCRRTAEKRERREKREDRRRRGYL